MKWLFSKKTKQTAATESLREKAQRPTVTVESIRAKLSDYQSKEGRSVFIGPSASQWESQFKREHEPKEVVKPRKVEPSY